MKFSCETCHYSTDMKSSYYKHLTTKRHIENSGINCPVDYYEQQINDLTLKISLIENKNNMLIDENGFLVSSIDDKILKYN